METLTTLKVIHITATVLLLLSGLGLAVLAWRKRSAGPTVTVQRPWAFVWLLMGICVVSMPFTGWWLVHLIGWPLLEQVTHAVAVDPDPNLRAEAQKRGWPGSCNPSGS